jgi:hypothetical protein
MINKALSVFIIFCLFLWEGLFFAASIKIPAFSSETLEQSVAVCCDTLFVCSFINKQLEKIMQRASQNTQNRSNKKPSDPSTDLKTIFLSALNLNPQSKSVKVCQPFISAVYDPLLVKDIIILNHRFLVVLLLFLILNSRFCLFLARSGIVPDALCFLLFKINPCHNVMRQGFFYCPGNAIREFI